VFCSLLSFLDAIKLWLLLVSPTFNGFLLLYQMCPFEDIVMHPLKKNATSVNFHRKFIGAEAYVALENMWIVYSTPYEILCGLLFEYSLHCQLINVLYLQPM
jgi:hypothetical protein